MKLIQARRAIQWFRIRRLYLRAFPADERKPFSVIRSLQEKQKTDVWYFEKGKAFAGFATTVNGEDTVLLDYLAVTEKKRGKGLGKEMMALLREQYAQKSVFLEIERVCDDAPNAEERMRRKQFYLSCGMRDMNVHANVFGVEMELLGWDCDIDFDRYRDFYRKNMGEFTVNNIKPAEDDLSS